MSYRSAYTLEEARDYLKLWKDCERALATGQVQSYTIGSRQLTMLDIDEVERMITKYANIVESYEQNKRTTRSVAIVPRDL